VVSSPAVVDGKVYVGSTDMKVYALNASSGALIWSYRTGSSVRSSSAVAEGKLYVGSDDGSVYAFSSLPTPTFTLTTNLAATDLSQSINLTGTLSTPASGSVSLYWSINSSGFAYRTTENLTNGVFSRTFGFGQTGTWQFRVNWPGDITSNPATSNVVTVTVVPVIPEFPPTVMLSLLIGATLLTAMLGRRTSKRKKPDYLFSPG
jgi:hypothetical protein